MNRTRNASALVVVLNVLAHAAPAQVPLEIAKLRASDTAPGIGFGGALGIDGDVAVVAAQNATGSVYIFQRNHGGPNNWGEVKKLLPVDVQVGHFFGYRVEVSGDTVMAGATRRTAAGVVYLFDRDAGGPGMWGQVAMRGPSDGDGEGTFGTGIDIDGDTAIVGANFASGHSGAAWVFQRNLGGANAWGERKKLSAADAGSGDEFGQNVAISGDTVVVGSLLDDDNGTNSGSAYIFERNAGGADNWGQVKKILAPDGAAGDHFGIDVAIDDDRIVVGADFNDGAAQDSGALYIFDRDAGGPNNWGFVHKLSAFDASAGDHLGLHVALHGDRVLSGAYLDDDHGINSGSVYLFERNAGGPGNWGQAAKFAASDTLTGDVFGITVGIDAETLLIGATSDDSGAGSAFVFYLNRAPAALCQNVVKVADESCLAGVTAVEVDSGSFDPDGDDLTLTLAPLGPFPLGDTIVTLTIEDNNGLTDSCQATVTVIDEAAPVIYCNNPPNLTPPNAPTSFTATATDNCGVLGVRTTDYDCFKYTNRGKRINKTDSCIVQLDGATVTIVESGGVADQITWSVTANDTSGNTITMACHLEVVNPGRVR